MKRWQRGLLLSVLAAVRACAADDETSDPGPSEEEIEAVQRSFCELETSCCQCFGASAALAFQNAVEECVAGLDGVYAFSEECRDAHFAWESCALELDEESKVDDPESHDCEAFSYEGRYGVCSEEWLARELVDCSL